MAMKKHLIHLEDEQIQALEKIKEASGASVAWQIRQAITDYLKKGKGDEE